MARWIVGSLWLVTFCAVMFFKLPPGPDIGVALVSYVLAAFTGLLWSDYIRNRPTAQPLQANEQDFAMWISKPPSFELSELEHADRRADKHHAMVCALEREAAAPRLIADEIVRTARFCADTREFIVSLHTIELGWSDEARRAWHLARKRVNPERPAPEKTT